MNLKLKLSSVLILIAIAFSPIASFNNINKNTLIKNNFHYFKNESLETPRCLAKEALPLDFFGDYSNPDYWTDTYWPKQKTKYIIWKMHTPKEYKHHKKHKGVGILTWTNYTKKYNQAIIHNNYNHYWHDYDCWVKQNPNGFRFLDSCKIKLKVFAEYVEDWIVWNMNKNHHDILGRDVLNKEVNLKTFYFDENSKWVSGPIDSIPDKTTLGSPHWKLTTSGILFYYFDKFFKDADYYVYSASDTTKNTPNQSPWPKEWFYFKPKKVNIKFWGLSSNSITRIYLPKNKNDIKKHINNKKINKWFSNDIAKFASHFKDVYNESFDELINGYLYWNPKLNKLVHQVGISEEVSIILNEEFINNGFRPREWIEYDDNQGFYGDINPFKKDDYKIKYFYKSDKNWLPILENSKQKISGMNSIKVEITSIANNRTLGSQNNVVNLIINPQNLPHIKPNNKLMIIIILFSIIHFTFVLFALLFMKLFKNSKNQTKKL